VSELDGGTWTTYTTSDGLVDDVVQAVAADADDDKWFGTQQGASQFGGGTWTNYTTADGLAHNSVQAVAADGENHKWFGTQSGLSEYIPDGVAATITAAAGGTLVSADGSTTLTFGAGAVVADLDLLFIPLSSLPADPHTGIGRYFELFAVQAGTSAPAVTDIPGSYTIEVTYTNDEISGIDETTLGLYAWDNGAWVMEPASTLDAENNTISAAPDHFSHWAVLAGEEVQEDFFVYLPLILRSGE
jgi:hypothetical protein